MIFDLVALVILFPIALLAGWRFEKMLEEQDANLIEIRNEEDR